MTGVLSLALAAPICSSVGTNASGWATLTTATRSPRWDRIQGLGVSSTNRLIVHGEARVDSPTPALHVSTVAGARGTITLAQSSAGGKSVLLPDTIHSRSGTGYYGQVRRIIAGIKVFGMISWERREMGESYLYARSLHRQGIREFERM